MSKNTLHKLREKLVTLLTPERLTNLSTVVALVIVWYAISTIVHPLFLPSPAEVFGRSYFVYHDTLGSDILYSLMRIVLGLVLGSLLGIGLGIAMSWSKIVEWWFDPIVEIVRPIPVLALIPLFILWFGIGELGKILLIAFGVFVRQVVITREAIKNVPSVYLKAAQTLGATEKAQLFRTVIFPSITPEIIGGLRVTVAAAFGYCAAAEFLGAQRGIGYMIIRARRYLYTFAVIFGIILFSSFSLIADRFVRYLDHRINIWTEREAQQ